MTGKIATLIYLITTLTTAAQSVSDFDWLIGTWTRTNIKTDRTAHERWTKVGENELSGWGVSMRGSDTTFVEKLKIISRDGEHSYVADVVENPNPVAFKIVSVGDHQFVCENPDHDFPKRISYLLRNDTLYAATSGNGKEIIFLFVKKR